MKKIFLILLNISLFLFIKAQDTTTSSYAEPIINVPHTYDLQQVQNFPCDAVLAEHLSEYQLYEFDFTELYQFTNSNRYLTEFKLNLPEKSYTISLQRNDLRSADYKSAIGIEGGSEIIYERNTVIDTNHIVKTFKGFSNGNPDNIVRFTIDENHFTGYIHDSQTDEWIFFDSYNHFTKDPCDDEDDVLIVYDVIDIIETGGCTQLILDFENSTPVKGQTDKCSPKYLEIATDADFEYFNNNGNNSNNEILSILNNVEGLYSYYFNLMFSVTHQRIWTSSSDPYSEERAQEKIVEVKQVLQSDFINIDRDLSIMFTGHSLLYHTNGNRSVSGIAYTGTICRSPSYSYAIVTDRVGNIGTTAHEIGHAFNMPHLFDTHPSQCTNDPGLMCYGDRDFFFNQPSIDAAIDHIENWGGCLNNIDPNNTNTNWLNTWSNERNKRWIGTWYLNNNDKKLVGDFDGDNDEELLFMSTSGWCNMVDFSCNTGSDWHHMWTNMGNGHIEYWYMKPNDKYVTGDFDGDGISELLSIDQDNNWALLHEFNSNTNTWDYKWGNSGNHWIGGSWNITTSTNKFIVADFTGDGKDNLLCINGTSWAMLFEYYGGNFHHIWNNGGSGDINSVPIRSDNTYLTGAFDGNTEESLLCFYGDNSTWVTLLEFDVSNNEWDWRYTQWGDPDFADMYILPLNSNQHMLSGNFDQDSKIEVLNINNQWSATADLGTYDFYQNWNNGGNFKFKDWKLNTGYANEYLTVKAIPQNETHVISIKYESTPFLWWHTNIHPELAKMYRSSELYNMKKPVNDYDNNTIGNDKLKLMIYPNPTANYINILIEEKIIEKNLQINIYDLIGNLIYSNSLSDLKTKIDLNNYSKGMYNIVLTNGDDVNITNKIIVK